MPREGDTHPRTVAVLSLLADDPTAWRYGYDIARHTGVRSGTLYPLLLRLAERGYLETQWERDPPEGRPRRHLYRLTGAGVIRAAQVFAAIRPQSQARQPPARQSQAGPAEAGLALEGA